MSHSVGEHLGLAGTGAGSDQQCRRRYSSAADAVFDGPALFRVEGVQMPTGVDRLQLVVPFPFVGDCDTIGATGSQMPRGSVGKTRRAFCLERTWRRVSTPTAAESSLRVAASSWAAAVVELRRRELPAFGDRHPVPSRHDSPVEEARLGTSAQRRVMPQQRWAPNGGKRWRRWANAA